MTVRAVYESLMTHMAGSAREARAAIKWHRKATVGCVCCDTPYDPERFRDFHDAHIDPRNSGHDGNSGANRTRGVRTGHGWSPFWHDLGETVPRHRPHHNAYDTAVKGYLADADPEVPVSVTLSDDEANTVRERQQCTALAVVDDLGTVGVVDLTTGAVIAPYPHRERTTHHDTPMEVQP